MNEPTCPTCGQPIPQKRETAAVFMGGKKYTYEGASSIKAMRQGRNGKIYIERGSKRIPILFVKEVKDES